MPTTIVADLRINTAGAYRDIDIFKSKLNRGISQPLGRISGDAAEFSKSLQAAAARVTAFGAITGGILAVNKAISAAARSTIEVNKQLVELNTFLGESQQNLDRFGKSLFNIARATATNFSDVAEAAKEFARQGLSTEETLKRTNDALVLSRVSGLNYAQSVNSITTAINGFNKEALSSTEIISKLIAVDSRFAVSAAQLSEALTRVGSSAEESGLSFDELVATITTAQQITGRGGAVIGNALKTIFTRVRRPEILDQLRQLGVVVEDQNGVLLNGIQILKNYSEATKNLSQAEKSRTAELLGGVYQINQLQAVIRDLSSANSIYSNSLKISISATDEAIKKNEQLNKSYSALISQTAATATQVGSDIGKNLFGPLITGGTSVIQSALKLLSPEKFEEAGITAGQAMAKGAGQEITKGISSAIGNALLYTGGPVLATIGAGLGIKLIRFIGASLKTQAKEITDPLGRVFTGGSFFGKEEREKLALQTQISGVMQRISGLTKDTATSTYKEATARRQVFQEIKRINLELQRQLSLSRAVASDLRVRGYSDIFEVPAARPTRRRRRSASGYIPNFADPVLMEEEQEARSKSAKNPKAYYTQATIKGKKQVIAVNDQEEIIPNFAGTGDTAIIPKYRKMQDIPRMSSGYVPNFAFSDLGTGATIENPNFSPKTRADFLRYKKLKKEGLIKKYISWLNKQKSGSNFVRYGENFMAVSDFEKNDAEKIFGRNLTQEEYDFFDLEDFRTNIQKSKRGFIPDQPIVKNKNFSQYFNPDLQYFTDPLSSSISDLSKTDRTNRSLIRRFSKGQNFNDIRKSFMDFLKKRSIQIGSFVKFNDNLFLDFAFENEKLKGPLKSLLSETSITSSFTPEEISSVKEGLGFTEEEAILYLKRGRAAKWQDFYQDPSSLLNKKSSKGLFLRSVIENLRSINTIKDAFKAPSYMGEDYQSEDLLEKIYLKSLTPLEAFKQVYGNRSTILNSNKEVIEFLKYRSLKTRKRGNDQVDFLFKDDFGLIKNNLGEIKSRKIVDFLIKNKNSKQFSKSFTEYGAAGQQRQYNYGDLIRYLDESDLPNGDKTSLPKAFESVRNRQSEIVKKEIEERIRKSNRVFPAIPHLSKDTERVKILRSEKDLYEEGHKMQHCVGGYGNACSIIEEKTGLPKSLVVSTGTATAELNPVRKRNIPNLKAISERKNILALKNQFRETSKVLEIIDNEPDFKNQNPEAQNAIKSHYKDLLSRIKKERLSIAKNYLDFRKARKTVPFTIDAYQIRGVGNQQASEKDMEAFRDFVRQNGSIPNFASGFIPNFAKSKFIENIVNSYKASLTEKDSIRLAQAQKAESYYPLVNSELKNLSSLSGYSLEKLAYSLAALSGNTADLDARRGLERILKNQPYDDLAILPKNVEKVKKMLSSSGSLEELMSILGKGAKTQNFAQSLLLSENFSGFGKYKNPLGTPSVMDSWAIYVRNGGALKAKYDRRAVSNKQKSKLFSQSPAGYKYYNTLVKEYGQAAKILGVPVRELQARTWGWARGQMGSVTRNSFASGYIPNFANNLDYNPNFLVGSGSDAIFLSAYDQLSGEFGGGPAYPEVVPGRSFATTSTGSLNTLNQNAMSIIRGGGKAFFSPVVNSNALESLGGNKFFLMALAKRYPRFSNFRLAREILKSPAGTFKISEIRGATNQIISNIQKNYGRNKGILRAREVAESISDKRFLNPQYKNLSTSLITEIVSNQGSIVAPNSGHSLYNLAALGGASKMSNPVQYQKIFEGLIDKDRLSGLRNSYIPIGRRFNLGDDFSKTLGLASGFIPNFARQNQKTFSPEFKKWFAGSKVVNEQGEPLMVYHGTNASFTTFRQAKEGTYGKGIYVTPDLEMATGYTTESAIGESRHQGGNIMPLYTSLQNPIEVVDKDGLGPLEALKKLGYTSDKAAKVWEKALESKGNLTTQIQKRAELFDNDGIIVRYPDGRIKEIVVFSPGQVKSSIGNKGTFDPLNPDIRYANGFIPNYSGLSDAIGREKTMSGLPASKIMAHFDRKGNPIAVTNKRDEPNGLKDIVPNFARPSLPRDARGRFTRRTIEAPPTPESASKDLIQFIVQTIGVGGLSAILNELYLNERISPEVNTALQIGIPILSGLAGARRGLRQSRGQSFGRRAASVGVPVGLGVAQAGLNIFSSSQITQDLQRRKLDKEIDAAAREFKSVTEGTQELVDTLSKLDAAFKDASTAPEQLVKLSKRESELVRNLSKTSPELSSKLATEPNLEKRIGIIEDIRREASRQQTIAEEIAYLKSPENKTPEDLNKSFSRFVSAAGENLFKFTSEDLKPENFGKITQESKLERLQEFLKDVDQTTKDKLIPLFLQSVDSEIKFLEANKETNKKISQIRGTEIKKRAEIDRARELRTTRTLALNEGLTDLSSFASQFGPRAAISFGVEADKMKKSLEVSSSFRSLLNLKATDKDLKLPENVSEALSKIENPSTETTNLIREMAKDKNLNQQQKDSLEELAVNSERQTKQLEQISKIGEINKEVQLKVLKIQEKLSFAGGIKTSTDAASRIASINAPLTGALQYRLGSMLGSERSQVSGLTNLLKSIQDKYPGMIDKSVDLKSVTDRLVALRTRDLQKDLFRDAGVLQSVGLGGTANILRTKAADTLSLRNIAETQVGAELQTGENPAEAIRYFGDVVRDSIDSLGAKFAEDRTIKKLESENLPKVQEETRKNEEFRASLQKNITDAIRGSLGDSFKLTGSKFDVSNSTVIINDVIDFLKNPLSYFGIGNTQQTNPPAAPPTTKSGGFIPSFYDPLREAISRESQYVPFNSIRVNQSEKLISSQNPMGLAVTNTIDEPAGLASIGLASRGFVPNFADEQEDIYEPGTAKIPLISKTVGRVLTNLTSPLGYDLASKGYDLTAGQIGEGEIGLIPSVILDRPTKSLQKRYQEKAYTSEGRTEFREPLYRWMFGLEPQTDWQKWYVKNPDKSIGFNQNTPEGKNLFRRAVLNAVQARLDFVSSGGVKGASAGRHDVMSNYGYSFEGGKLKFFDRWDFDPHPGEGGLSDYFKSKTEPVPQNIAPGSQYAISNQDTTSGSFGSRLKNSVRGMVSATTAPVTIRGEIPIADLPKFFKENKTIWRYSDGKTGKKLNNYPFLEQDPSSVLRRLNLQNDSIASKASGFIPNFAAFGKNVAQQAIENARAGKLYVWDNIDDIYRKVKSDGGVESEGIRRLPRDAKIISTAIVKGNFNDERNILNLQDPKFTKLDELELPSVARSKKIDRIISKLKKQGQLTPKNLLDKINELSQGRPALVKTAFGTSNFKSKGVYGLEGELTIKDTKSIIDRFNKGTGSGFFIQEKVPTHYNELRVHVAVDENGRVKIVKGGTILKFTGFDPTSQPSVDAYREAGLSRRQATRMARSFKKSAEATAVENIRNIVKNKNIRNAFFGVDVGGTTLEAAIEAGVKPREFYSGGRGRVSTIVFEVNPSEAEGSSGFVGRGVVPKLVKSIMGQKPSQGVAPPEIAILGTNRSGAPRLPAIGGAPTVAPTASGTPNINIKQSSVVNSVKDLALRIKNSKLGSGISGLSGKVAQGASRFLSGSAMNVIGRASGVAGKVTKPLIALGGLGTIGESIGEFKDKNYGLAGLKAGEGSLLLASLAEKATGKIGLGEKLTAKSLGVKNLMNLGGKAFGVASMLGLASEIAYAKNNQLAEDFGDLFLGKKSVDPETGKKYRSTSDLIAGGVGLGFDALAATNPLGQAYIAMKYGYRTGNILEEKLGIGNMLGESFLYAGSTMAERARRAKQSNLGEGISKQDVVEGRVSLEAYLAYKRRLLEEKEAGLENMSRGFIPNFAKGQLTIEEQLEQDKLEIEEQKRKRAEQEEAAKQERIKQAEIAAAAAAKREEQRKVDRARQDEENELRQQESDTRSKLVQGVIENEETNQLYTSRDKANYLISQERIFGTFTRENFKGNEDLYDSYQAYKREKENQAEAERRLMKPKETDFYVEGVTKPELLNKRKAEFARAQETAEATREFRQRAATEAEALGGATAAQRKEAYDKGIPLEKVIPETQRPANFVRAGLGLPPLPSVDKNIINPQTYGEVINGRFYTKDQIKEAYDKGVSVESIKFGNRRIRMPKLPTQEKSKKTKSSFGIEAQFMASITDVGLNIGIFVDGVYYTQSEITEAKKLRISPAELRRRKRKNKSSGFVPNFSVSAFAREKLDVLTSPDYSGYRNAVPQPSKYYKNVIKNSAEIEVPAVEVYNRMGLFGAKPKNSNEQYAILNPAQQAQLGYASKGFVPNFAPEQFAGAVGEAMQKALAPYFEKAGSSVTNSNVININDQRTIQTNSEKVYAVMEFLQDQFPTQFARKMGPQSV